MKSNPCNIATLFALVIIVMAPAYTGFDPYQLNFAERLAPPTYSHPFGTDDLGRDLLGRFIVGTRTSLRTGLTTALIAAALGWLSALAASRVAAPGQLIVLLAYAGFVVPNLLLAPTRTARALVAVLCGLLLLPLLWFGLVAIVLEDLLGNSLVLGALFAIAAAFILHRDGQAPTQLPTLIPLTLWLVVWSVYAHTAFDALGLGVQPPLPSWGTLLSVQSGSLLPNLVAGLCLLTLLLVPLALNAEKTTASTKS